METNGSPLYWIEDIVGYCVYSLGIFYVNAYEDQTEAALYETIKNQQERGE